MVEWKGDRRTALGGVLSPSEDITRRFARCRARLGRDEAVGAHAEREGASGGVSTVFRKRNIHNH